MKNFSCNIKVLIVPKSVYGFLELGGTNLQNTTNGLVPDLFKETWTFEIAHLAYAPFYLIKLPPTRRTTSSDLK